MWLIKSKISNSSQNHLELYEATIKNDNSERNQLCLEQISEPMRWSFAACFLGFFYLICLLFATVEHEDSTWLGMSWTFTETIDPTLAQTMQANSDIVHKYYGSYRAQIHENHAVFTQSRAHVKLLKVDPKHGQATNLDKDNNSHEITTPDLLNERADHILQSPSVSIYMYCSSTEAHKYTVVQIVVELRRLL